MENALSALTGCLTLMGIVSALNLSETTEAGACSSQTWHGMTVCAVDVKHFSSRCPARSHLTVCEESFQAAIQAAQSYYDGGGHSSFLISVPAGSYDFSSETTGLTNLDAAIDVSSPLGRNTDAAGTACALPVFHDGKLTGSLAFSGGPCLIIDGAGQAHTTLTTSGSLTTFKGQNVSHLFVGDMTLRQPDRTATQGTLVSTGTYTSAATHFRYPTLVVDFDPDFPMPQALFDYNCSDNASSTDQCAKGGHLRALKDAIYMRAYTKGDHPQLVQSTRCASADCTDINAQLSWGYPADDQDHIQEVVPPKRDPNVSNRWTLTASLPEAVQPVPSYFRNPANMVCMKVDSGQSFYLAGPAAGGADVIFDHIDWINASRGEFHDIRAHLAGARITSYGGVVFNSRIERDGAKPDGHIPCLASQSGGMQFNTVGPRTYGNLVYGLNSDASGDDTIAMFSDIGGSMGYPRSRIEHSSLANSFARDILLYEPKAVKSPVLVDLYTKSHVVNCDKYVLKKSIVTGTWNCPVTYKP